MRGVVLKSTGSWHNVKTEKGVYNCKIRGKMRVEEFETTNPVAVGDNVEFELEDDNTGVITEIYERKNCIIRQSTNLSKQTHIIACNVDQAIILASLKEPDTPPEFIDRFLVSCEVYQVKPVIIFNKTDLYSEKELSLLKELSETYKSIGYECFSISVLENKNINKVVDLLKNKVSAISGNSGVGKSSLIKMISPELNIKIAEISKKHKTGKHTTTYAEMFELGFGGYIIDTPGIRAFGISFIEKELIAQNFPEMYDLLDKCKYYNCQHIDEPNCAVKDAFENGKIAYTRYKSYLNMMTEEENKYRKD